MNISLFIPGIPVAKGSTHAFLHKSTGRVITMQTNRAKQRPWASLISCMTLPLIDQAAAGPVFVSMLFQLPRPKAHYRGKANVLRDDAPIHHIGKPDVDKLARCVLDALTGIAWRDDSQAQIMEARKIYAPEPGLWLQLTDKYTEAK